MGWPRTEAALAKEPVTASQIRIFQNYSVTVFQVNQSSLKLGEERKSQGFFSCLWLLGVFLVGWEMTEMQS